jgi:hypothetical protein
MVISQGDNSMPYTISGLSYLENSSIPKVIFKEGLEVDQGPLDEELE